MCLTDCGTSPCLLAGTSLGSVLVLSINLPPDGAARQATDPVSVLQTGNLVLSLFRHLFDSVYCDMFMIAVCSFYLFCHLFIFLLIN